MFYKTHTGPFGSPLKFGVCDHPAAKLAYA